MKQNHTLFVITIALVGVVVFQHFKITGLELSNETYDKEVHQLKIEREKQRLKADSIILEIQMLEQVNDSLLDIYLNTPTDVDIVKERPTIILDVNSEWSAITNTIIQVDADTIFQ